MDEMIPRARRDLDLFPIRHEGKQAVLIRDPLGLVREGTALPLPIYRLLSMLDGNTRVQDLQVALMHQQGGLLVGRAEVEKLLAELDRLYLLESRRFRDAKGRLIQEFVRSDRRSASHAGHSYPARPRELKSRLDDILEGGKDAQDPSENICALVAPHIDLSAGQKVYASAYRSIRHANPSTIVVLGVGHYMAEGLFSLTPKTFQTPLGEVKAERELFERLREKGGGAVAGDDFAHRTEHSIEFQVLFLQHLFPHARFTILPILCGSPQVCLSHCTREDYLEKAGGFIEELRRILGEKSDRTLVVAGVDFSHIGPKFGHEASARTLAPDSRAHDTRLLNRLCAFDASGFWEESSAVNDRFNVCGFSALACMLEVLPECRGEVLDYDVWHEEATQSAVSFSAVAFTPAANA